MFERFRKKREPLFKPKQAEGKPPKRKRGRPRKNKNVPQEKKSFFKPNKPKFSFKISKPQRKIKVPGLKLVNQAIAAVMLIMNFFISQAALLSRSSNQSMFWLFIINSYVCLLCLWKSRS